jgi:hypothetical protein
MSEERISRLRVPEERMLPEDIRELYAKNREKPGFVPNVFRASSLRPSSCVALSHYIKRSWTANQASPRPSAR